MIPTGLPERTARLKPQALPWKLFFMLSVLMAVGAVTFLALLLGADPVRGWGIFLVNLLFWSGVSIAGVVWGAIFQVTNARWTGPIKWLGMASAAYLPITFLLFLGLWFGHRSLFPWVEQPVTAIQSWLNIPFLFARETLSLLFLYGVSLLFFYRSVQQETQAAMSRHLQSQSIDASNSSSLRKLAVGVLIVYALAYSLLALDFVMSLDPSWSSALFGGFYFIGNLYLGLAALTIAAVYARWRHGLETMIDFRIFHNLGKLLFAFSLLWTYLFWSQYLVIWYGNLPHEIGFVLRRTAHKPWAVLAIVVLVMNFLVPFILLLSRAAKENPKTLLEVALVIFTGMWLERYLLVMPSLVPTPPTLLGWADLLITMGFLASFLAVYSIVISKIPVQWLRDAATPAKTGSRWL